jgi:hypothetical protein
MGRTKGKKLSNDAAEHNKTNQDGHPIALFPRADAGTPYTLTLPFLKQVHEVLSRNVDQLVKRLSLAEIETALLAAEHLLPLLPPFYPNWPNCSPGLADGNAKALDKIQQRSTLLEFPHPFVHGLPLGNDVVAAHFESNWDALSDMQREKIQREWATPPPQVATVFTTDSGADWPLMLTDSLHQQWLDAGKSGYPLYASVASLDVQAIGCLRVEHLPRTVRTHLTANSRVWDVPTGSYLLHASTPSSSIVIGLLTVAVAEGGTQVTIDTYPAAAKLDNGVFPLHLLYALHSPPPEETGAPGANSLKEALLARGCFLLWTKLPAETPAVLETGARTCPLEP